MSDLNREIGERIKGIRELSDLTLAELADKLNTTEGLLARYEQGAQDIPVSILHNISNALNIGMTELLTGESPKLSVYSVVRCGMGVGVERRADYDYKSLAYNFVHRKMEPFLITIEPRPEGEAISLNAHSGQEFHYCLEGSFKMVIDKHELVINEGDALYFDSKYPHGMQALNGKPARELVIIL
ncbi:MAG: XRE family transcriptional regulator [Clostridiales bacterium]|jgi:transcriptional regulator with XRE-family HTH domain|nr:XRE family transcriptional regulator [Clostridiales bacterium]